MITIEQKLEDRDCLNIKWRSGIAPDRRFIFTMLVLCWAYSASIRIILPFFQLNQFNSLALSEVAAILPL